MKVFKNISIDSYSVFRDLGQAIFCMKKKRLQRKEKMCNAAKDKVSWKIQVEKQS